MSKPVPLTRKEIAQMVGVHPDTVARNEKLWGLDKAKVDTGNQTVWFIRSKACYILRQRGLIDP